MQHRLVSVVVASVASVLSVFGAEPWFDAGIRNYEKWPLGGAEMRVPGVGAWSGTRYAELIGEAGAKELKIVAPLDLAVGFSLESPKLVSEKVVRVSTTMRNTVFNHVEDLPTPPPDAKCALSAAMVTADDAAYFGLQWNEVDEVNEWVRLTGAVPATNETVTITFEFRTDGPLRRLVRHLVGDVALRTEAGDEWVWVMFPSEADEDVAAVMYCGDCNVSGLCGSTETETPKIGLTIDETELENMTVASVLVGGIAAERDGDGAWQVPQGALVTVRFAPTPGYALTQSFMTFTAGAEPMTLPAEGRPTAVSVGAFIAINEVMASNGETLTTAKGVAEIDWVELVNTGDLDIDLTEWYFGNDPTKKASKWTDFRIQGSCIVPAHGYKIVWFDGDTICPDAKYAADEAFVRCNVSTSAGKHTLFLSPVAGAESVITPLTLPAQLKDISYGPGADDGVWHYYRTPTPGKANTTHGYGPVTPSVAFDTPHGYKTEAFDLTLSCPDAPGATIRYTLDGTSPTSASAVYTDPIRISSTTCIRAAVLQDNTVLQLDTSATYLFLDDILSQSSTPPAGFPETGAVNKQKMVYGMNQGVVTGADRERLLRGFTNSVATVSLVIDPKNLFDGTSGIYVNAQKDGKEWERQTMVEQIDPVNGVDNEFSIAAGLRIRGAFSRGEGCPKHSFRLFFRSEYGYGSLDHPMFGDEGTDEFDKIDLRTSQNSGWANGYTDDTFVHETFSRDSQRDMGEPYNRSRYYNLFINGTYWGLYQTEERVDQDYAASYNKGNAQDYDIVRTSQPNYKTEVVEGETKGWTDLWRITTQEGYGASHLANYNRVRGLNADGTRNPDYPVLLNVTNLVTMLLTAQFTGDGDSPVNSGGMPNNIIAYRNRVDGAGTRDGFLWNRHDAEHSLGHNTGTAYNNTASLTYGATNTELSRFNPVALHYALCANDEYRMTFADLVYKHILRKGGALTAAEGEARYRSRMAELDDVIVCESARWGGGSNDRTYTTWAKRCEKDISYINQRTPYLIAGYRNLGWYPSIDPVKPVNDLGSVVEDGETIAADGRLYLTGVAGGRIYYTTDGSDPRAEGGAVGAGAIEYTGGSPVMEEAVAIKSGDAWKYYQAGNCPAADWMAADYDDASWSVGKSKLGFGSGTFGTKLNRYVNGTSGAQVNTFYFRREFAMPAYAAEMKSLRASLDCDDGYVVYINGVEVGRDQVSSTAYDAFATGTNLGARETEFTFPAGTLREGANVIAVEVHQCNATSSDAWWDLRLAYDMPVGGEATGIAIPPEGANLTMRVLSADGEWSVLDTISVKGAAVMSTQAEAVRVAAVYSSTATDGGDSGEFVVLTNVTGNAVDLTGVTFACAKTGNELANLFTVAGGRLEAGAAVTISQAEYGWKKITNGKVDMTLTTGDGELIQTLHIDADWWKGRCDETGNYFVAKEFGPTVTDIAQWKPSVSWAEEGLRFFEIEGIPAEGNDGAGEYFVLTNILTSVEIDLTGLKIVIGKASDIAADGDSAAKCIVQPTSGVIAAGSTFKFDRPTYGWNKITDGDLTLKIYDAEGALVQLSAVKQKSFANYAEGRKVLRATSFARETMTTDWAEADLPQSGSKVEGDGFLFYLTGEFTEPAVIKPTGDTCRVILDGATVPGLTLLGAADFTVAVSNENHLTSLSASAATVTLEGDGALRLEGENTLASVSNLVVKSGTFAVKSTGVSATQTPVVNVLGSVTQTGGTIDVDLDVATANQIYGIYIANKNMDAKFSGGTFTAKVGGTKSAAIYGEKGSVNPSFSGDIAVTAELTGPEARFVNAKGKLKLKGGTFGITMPAEYATLTDARVFKADEDIEISGGTFSVNVPATGSEIFSTDAGIAVSGGILSLEAADDCFSATGDITISDGIVHALSTAGDAIDSNGNVTISGGKVFAFTLSADHDAIDVDPILTESSSETHNLIILEGATVVAVGGDQEYFHQPDAGSTATIYTATGLSSSKKYVELTGVLASDSAKTTTVLSVNWNKRHAAPFTLIATMPGYDGQGYAEAKDKPTDVYENAYKLNDNIDGVFLRETVESLGADWPEDPETEITEDTKPADLGITVGAFAEATPAELRKLATWAKAKGVKFGCTEINAMAFDAGGNPATVFEEAYLLNCKPDEVAAAKAAFKFDAIVPGKVPTIEGSFNGTVTIMGATTLANGGDWAPNKPGAAFFKAVLTR